MKNLRLRRVVSLSMLLIAAVLTYTGVMLYIAPQGRVAYWTDWQLLGLSKEQLGGIHTTCSFLFVALGLLHTWYNWKPIVNYLKNKSKQLKVVTPDMVVASVLVTLFVVGTGLGLPPFQQIVDVGEAIKDWWEEREGSPPYGHAELSPLESLTGRMGWDTQACLGFLDERGLVIGGARETLGDIAAANGMSPAQLFALMEGAAALRPA
jgi:hypothetical protein